MTNEEFLTGMMAVFRAVDRLSVAVAVGGVIVLTAAGIWFLVRRRIGWALGCFALAAAPFVLQAMAITRQDTRLSDRAAQVRGFERTPLTADYPRVLETQMEWVPPRILPMGWFDEVHVVGEGLFPHDRPGRREVYRWRDTPDCRAIADATRTAARFRAPPSYERKACVTLETVEDAPTPDAVILLRDNQTTLRRHGGIHHLGGTLELRLRRDGREVLVDYWEAPYVKRPRSPALGQTALDARSEPPQERSPADFLRDNLPGAVGTAPTG